MVKVLNPYRAQRGKAKWPSRLMARTRVAYLLLRVSVSAINLRAQRGKGDCPSAPMRRTRVGVRFLRTAVSALKGAA